MDDPLLLTRVVRKVTIGFELIDGQGDSSSNHVECLSSEQTPRSLLGILCRPNCKEPHHGQDSDATVGKKRGSAARGLGASGLDRGAPSGSRGMHVVVHRTGFSSFRARRQVRNV